MVMHFSTGADQVACGRNNHNVTASSAREMVTCKTCLRSAAFAASPVVPAPASKEPVGETLARAQPAAPRTASPHRMNVAYEEWRARLSHGDRLPRGRHLKQSRTRHRVSIGA